MKNIYLVSQNERRNYDTYDSFVTIAETEEEARNTHPDGDSSRWSGSYSSWASSPEKVFVSLLGVAKEGSDSGIICVSYNAG